MILTLLKQVHVRANLMLDTAAHISEQNVTNAVFVFAVQQDHPKLPEGFQEESRRHEGALYAIISLPPMFQASSLLSTRTTVPITHCYNV
jgi:hypothetical protein